MKLNIRLLVLYITSLSSLGNAIGNNDFIHINLSLLNSSNPIYYTQYDSLQGYTEIHLDGSTQYEYLIVQVHSFKHTVFLSNTSDYNPDTTVNGTNIGLFQIYQPYLDENKVYYLYGNAYENISVLVAIVGYNSSVPIPGGCNLTFDVEIAPFQRVTNENYLVRVDAQAPSLYDGYCPHGKIETELYHMYLDEWDLSQYGYFDAIKKMLTVDAVRKHGRKVSKTRSFPVLRRYYAAYFGTGSVFSIIASHKGHESVYIPAVSYACGFDTQPNDCYEQVSIYWKVLFGLMVFFGLFMCFQGHRFFQVSLFFTGFFVAAVFTYIILVYMQLTDAETVISLSIIGIIYGAFWVTMWWKFGIPILSVTLSFIVAGYLAASLFFYIGLADIPIFQNDINYWSVLIGISLLVTLALQILSHLHSNIIATSFLGAYITIVPFDYYIGGNIRYIFLNTLHRATVPHFNLAVTDPPFQTNDQNLFISWVLVTAIGIYAQWRQNRGRAPFPPPPTMSERTPLLGASYA